MGLTITYTLSSRRKLAEKTLIQLVERTSEFGAKIGCAEIHGPQFGGPALWNMWKLPDGSTTGEPVSPLEGCSVTVLPGEGCETADFGLCRYPRVKGWKLTSWCKTQYAARHGIDHFLVCHRRIISLLDLWRDFGADVVVFDEGDYWQSRSLEQLRRRVEIYDRLTAAVAGTVKDVAGDHAPKIKAEIFKDSRFERLEAEGRAQFAGQIDDLRKRLGLS